MKQTIHVTIYVAFSIMIMILSPGCLKYHKIAREEFPQGKEHKKDLRVAREDIRRGKVYDEFSTKALFDVMMFSPQVRRAHNELYCEKRGLGSEKRISFIRDREIDLKDKMVFYVLSDVRERKNVELHKKKSHWNMYIELKKHKVVPSKIEEVELSPELKKLFGEQHSHFKHAYRVEFDFESRHDLMSEVAVHKDFTFVFDSVDRKCEVDWKKKEKRNSIYENHYWI